MHRTLSLILLCLLVFSFTPSCTSGPPPKKEAFSPEVLSKEIESSKQVKAMNERILMSSLASRKDFDRDYRIGPEDLLEISVFEDEKLNKAVRVSSQGNISLTLIGVIRVKGLTANELEREIRDLLAEKYLQDPHVSVFIKEYRSQRISVIGSVEKPSVFEVTGQKTILDALALAGGLKQDAGMFLFLIRPPKAKDEAPNEQGEIPKTFVIDLEELLVKGDLSLNMPLIHGDVLNIPVSGKIFVGGEVKTPGGFPLSGKKVTVSQAIVMAGGMKPEASGSETKIFRYSGKNAEREIVPINVNAILKGRGEDPYLQENDIVVVPKSGAKAFLIEFRDTLKGLLGFGFSLGTL